MDMKTLESKPNQSQQPDELKLEESIPQKTHEEKKKIEDPKENLPPDQEAMNKIEEPKKSLLLPDHGMKKTEEPRQGLLLPKEAKNKIAGSERSLVSVQMQSKNPTEEPKQERKNSETEFKIDDLMRRNLEAKEDQIKQKHRSKSNSHVWDCGSSLYDSFELNSFQRQLDSAIISASSARTLSMPHLSDRSAAPTVAAPPPPKKNKISRSLQKLLKSVFKIPKHSSSVPSSPILKAYGGDIDKYCVVYDKSGALTTIPEAAEVEVGPEISSLVRRTASDRFTAKRAVSISCA